MCSHPGSFSLFLFIQLCVLVLPLFSVVYLSSRWTGLVFYHSQNEIVKGALSVLLVVINIVFFIAGLRIFWHEFVFVLQFSIDPPPCREAPVECL